MSDIYFNEMHEKLANDYGADEQGDTPYRCSQIAYDLMKLLKKEGKDPDTAHLEGRTVTESIWPEPIFPRVYEGRVAWRQHYVCVESGLVYDPMLDHPEPIDEYMQTAFTVPFTQLYDTSLYTPE